MARNSQIAKWRAEMTREIRRMPMERVRQIANPQHRRAWLDELGIPWGDAWESWARQRIVERLQTDGT